MKKIIYIALLILLFCVSCTKAPDTDKNYTDNCIYVKMNGTFYRFNTETGTTSPLCPDPLCKHDDEKCPFFGVEANPVFIGQYIYYLSGATDTSEATTLCRFDLRSGKYEKLYGPFGMLSGLSVYGDCSYFNKGQNSKNGSIEFLMMKFDMNARKVSMLTETAQNTPQYLLSYDSEKLYWKTGAGDYYSTDLEYKNRTDGEKGFSDKLSSDNYSFSVEPTGEIKGVTNSKLPAYRLLRKDKTTDETVTVIEEMCPFPLIYNDSILYFKFQDSVPLIGYMYDESTKSKLAVTDKRGGKLYICDLDGKNEKLLCDITDSGCTFADTVGAAGKSGSGDYIGVELHTYGKDGEYIKPGKSALLIVNIKTGDYKIIRVE